MSKFSTDEFKKWLDKKFDAKIPRRRHIGEHVEAIFRNKKKLASKLCVREGTLSELLEDFIKKGGEVIEVDGLHLLVAVNSGTFSVPENCVMYC